MSENSVEKMQVFQSRDDHVVNPRNGPRIVRLVGPSRVELLWLDNSFHVATLDNDKDLISERTAAFIKSIAGRCASFAHRMYATLQ